MTVDVFLFYDRAGRCWRSEGPFPPTPHASAVLWTYGDETRIFIVGNREASAAIAATIMQAKEVGAASVWLCGPAACGAEVQEPSPEEVIYRMRSIPLGVVGGFHRAGKVDWATHNLIAAPPEAKGSWSERFRLRQHPAWFGLCFLEGMNTDACIEVLTEIVDPRWFSLPDRPYRSSRLKSFFGLTHSVQKLVTAGRHDPRNQLHKRCEMLKRCWSAATPPKGPGAFLWRERSSDDEAMNDFAMSRLFLVYLRHTWTDALLAASCGRRLQWFVPETFFLDPALAGAFTEYARTVSCERGNSDST